MVRYLGQYTGLEPGDTVNAGTPAEVASGFPGTPHLRAEDTAELEIDGLGSRRQMFGRG
ncbi:fumarylacetoacetate hydrolase family protein [Streptomyces sp. NPDC059153]|uniref:fumarylacetoacetate hydrolase family protein n=1 Tax=unclassified Streptomyces TaxID=2593676 RepID=UPI0036916C30